MGQVLAKIRKLFTSLIKIIVYCKSGKTRSSTSSVSESLISTPNVEEIQERVISTVPDSHIISITREYEEESIDASPSTNVTVEEKKQFTTVSDAHIGNIYEENEDISKGSEQLKEESQSDAGTSCDDINVIDERGQVITIQDAHERKGSERIAQDSQINNSVTSIAVKEDRDSIVQKKAVPKPPEKKIIWIKHYCSSHKILLVGEGDFSFSACLANVFGSGSNMVATSLNSKTFLKKNYAEAMSNIKDLKSRGCTLIHNFDATAMWKNWNLLNLSRFDRIIFNFPLVGLLPGRARKKQLKWNRALVRGFMAQAKELLQNEGEIHITHKTSAIYYEWNLENLARHNGLRLIEDVQFSLTDYPGYNNKSGFGGDNDFHCYPSRTYKFGRNE